MLPTLPHAFEAPLPMTLIWLTFIASWLALALIAWVAFIEARRNAAARRAIAADPPRPHWSLREATGPLFTARGMSREIDQ